MFKTFSQHLYMIWSCFRTDFQRSESKTWTQDEAEAYCRDHMNESPLYALCEDVPNALPENAVYDCISDITVILNKL